VCACVFSAPFVGLLTDLINARHSVPPIASDFILCQGFAIAYEHFRRISAFGVSSDGCRRIIRTPFGALAWGTAQTVLVFFCTDAVKQLVP
jgi:hypothetical protein